MSSAPGTRVLYLTVTIGALASTSHAADGLLAHWVFDREHFDGSVVEPTVGGPRVTVSGSARLDTGFLEALVLDGETTGLSVGRDAGTVPLPSMAMTVAAWIRVDRAEEWGGIVSAIQDNGDFEKGWMLGLNASRFTFGLSTRGADDGDGKITYVRAATRFRRGRWYHVAGTYDGVLQCLYVNGRLQGVDSSQTGEVNYPARVFFDLGAYHDDDELHRLAGRLREVRLYDRELAPGEIAGLYGSAEAARARSERSRAEPAREGTERAASSPGRSDWSLYLGDRARSGATSAEVALPLVELWCHRARRRPRPSWPAPARGSFWQRLQTLKPRVVYDRAFHVVAADDRVYFGSSSEDQVFCLDGAGGRVLWTFFAGGPIRFAPALAEGRVYVGSDDGAVYCLDGATGALEWKYRAAPDDRRIMGNGRMISAWPVRTGVLVDAGVVYLTAGLFPSQGVYAACLDATDGRELWRRQLEGVSPQGYLLASPARLYVPGGRAQPFALRRRDGQFLRSFRTSGGAYALLTGESLVSGPGDLGTLDVSDTRSSDHLATFDGNHLVVDGPRSYLHTDTELRALDRERFVRLNEAKRGLAQLLRQVEKISRTEAQGRASVAARLSHERERLGAELERISQELRECVPWTTPCPHPLSLILAGEVLFAGGKSEVGAYSARDGRLLWTGAVDGEALGLAVADGRLLVTTDTGRIHAFGDLTHSGGGGERTDAPGPAAGASRSSEGRESASSEGSDSRSREHGAAAGRILATTGVRQGVCLVLGSSSGRLAAALAQQSELTIIGVDLDSERVLAAREFLADQGLYGERVAVETLSSATLPLTDYFANLIVSEECSTSGRLPVPASEAYRVLRPCGGVILLHGPDPTESSPELDRGKEEDAGETPDGAGSLREWVRAGGVHGWSWSADGRTVSLRRGPLRGSGEWTHQYADPGNTASSRDELARPSTLLQWFGDPGPRRVLDRHLRTVPPLFSFGRLFVPGDGLVVGVDAYNGTELWEARIPGSRRVGAPYDASYMAASRETLYVATADECWAIDARSGQRTRTFRVPSPLSSKTPSGEPERHWGYVATVGDALYGSGQKSTASRRRMSREEIVEQYREFRPLVTSESLFCFDRTTGEERWHREGSQIVNTTLTLGGGRMYFVESRSHPTASLERGRLTLEALFEGDTSLVALDSGTGHIQWERPFDHERFRHILFLSYADEVLVASGSTNERRSTLYHLRAFSAADGEPLWQADHPNNREGVGGNHGEQVHHPVITGNTVISEPWAFDLRTGKRVHPGGGSAPWSLPRRSGCGTLSASSSCLYFRDSHPAVLDLESGGAVRKLTQASRPGCWISIIPAGGLVLLPEASSGCVCAYPLQTSVALLPR